MYVYDAEGGGGRGYRLNGASEFISKRRGGDPSKPFQQMVLE